jgi:SAM-dependent methyltransferase
MHDHRHERRFSPDKMARLDAPERQAFQPPAPLIEAMEIDADARVLDLGAGTGYLSLPIARRLVEQGGDGQVFALDVAPLMLAELGRRAEAAGLSARVRLIEADGDRPLPLDEASIDQTVAVNLVHELDDRPRAFAELARALRPGGAFFIVDWRPEGPFDHGPPADHRLSSGVVTAELLAAGFAGVNSLEIYRHFYVLRAAR